MRRDGRADSLFDQLGAAIAAGTHPPGSTLPTEAGLALEHGVGRSSVREALRGLEGLGMVSAAPRRGTSIRPRSQWNALSPEVLRWSIASGTGHARAALSAIDEARRIFEPASAALVAGRASRTEMLAIESAFARMEEAAARGDPAAAVQADRDFHAAILAATGNPILQAFNAAITQLLGLLFEVTANHMPNFRANLPNHLAVLEAIRARDPAQAAAAMQATIDFTSARLRENRLIG